ncbi:hypothetical protein N7463_009452 [Penicillium fimorum]|uniref:CFEM domain-containing protein n=1 Tax=Penicillium fimorum TaxID=1882269 RepID=A0A9W9XRY5_9EURO|nr:hypothetical protein N7463_009452 [Penicillium fimorum]
MKFSTTLIAFVAAGLASAQLPDVPACSLSCFLSALQSDGCSELLDFECHCKKTELVTSITPCVEKACEYKDQIAVSNAVVDQCSSAGEPISIPPIETGAETTTAAAEPTKTPTVPETTTAKPTEPASPSSSEGEGESSTTGAPAPGTTTAAGTTIIGSSSGVASSTPLVTKTGSAPASSSPAFNGAGSVKGNMAGVAALAAAAAYVL